MGQHARTRLAQIVELLPHFSRLFTVAGPCHSTGKNCANLDEDVLTNCPCWLIYGLIGW